MRYSLLLYHGDPKSGDIDATDMARFMVAFDNYAQSLQQAGVLVSADILQPSASTTTLTLRTGHLQIQDGPFIETKEYLMGAFVIEVADQASALAWAEQCPGARYGVIEIRPSATTFSDGQWQRAKTVNKINSAAT